MPTEAWNFCAVAQVVGDWWHREHSWGAARVVVRAPPLQTTASCFISPLVGLRAASIGPTNPIGADVAWQSRQVPGCVVSDACKRPGKKAPVLAPAWQAAHATEDGTVALLWNIGIGSLSLCTVTAVIDVPLYDGSSAATTTSCDASRTPSGVPMPALQSPPGSVPDALK